jgi:hypothetical protein
MRPNLIEEHEPARVYLRGSGPPARAQPPDVRALLLAGVQDFFFTVRP